MKTILFDKTGEPLKVLFKVKNGVVSASYTIELFNYGEIDPFVTFIGDNINPNPEWFNLPLPIENNDLRMIQLTVDFKGLDMELSNKYLMGFEVYQDDNLLDFISEEGEISPKNQNSTLLAYLKANGQ
jgi:hypothetical protein